MRIRDFLEFDFFLLFASLVLVVVGILFIYSSGVTSEGELISNEYRRQMIWAVVGLVFAIVIAMLNYRRVYDVTVYLYLGTLVLLLYILVMGRLAQGSRWLRIGSFGIQVSEFAKITTILFLAWYLDNTRRSQKAFIRFIVSCAIVLVPMMMILVQPDLGTSLVFIPILMGMCFIAGVSLRYIVFLGVSIVLAGILLVLPLWQTSIMNNTVPALMVLTNRRFVAASCLSLFIIAVIAWFGFVRPYAP